MKTSIKLKSIIFLGVLLSLTLASTSIIVLSGIEANQQNRYENLLAQQARTANLYLIQDYAAQSNLTPQAYLTERGYVAARQISQLVGTQVIFYNMTGSEIGNSAPGLNSKSVEDTLAYALQGSTAYQISDQAVYYLAPVIISENQIAVVQLFYSLTEDQAFYSNIKSLFIKIGSLIFLISFISGYFYFNRISKVINKLKSAVDNIRSGRYRDIPEVNRRDELGALRQGIYFMSTRIEGSIEDMRLALEKLGALEQQQRQFIGNVTHEFKTPLTVIKAYIDLMEMYPEDQDLISDAKINIARETQSLHEMVEKTLELAALEKYDFEAKTERIEIAELLNDICDRMEGKVKKFDLTLYREIEKAEVLADKESLFQIFVNLIDNAIKYNKSNGNIMVESHIKGEKLHVSVSDTGIGIPNEARDKVFEAFYRVDKDRSRETGGTGLGLALVKQLVEKQNGSIAIADTDGHGTTFLITFSLV